MKRIIVELKFHLIRVLFLGKLKKQKLLIIYCVRFLNPSNFIMKIKRFKNSIKDACHGARYVFVNEQNFRIQTLASFVVIVFMFVFELRKSEMIVIMMLVLLVLILELLNSALEKFVDIIKPRLHYQVEIVKDIMAAMVLFASLGAMIIGVMIFFP